MTALLALLATALAAVAQESSALQFSFSNPGARSLGFGGAFVVLAFDVQFPDVYGLGLVFRARNDALTVSVEWDLVE